ncbi:MAG TPA: phytochelatin synthase family protein [Polyangiaceae bacterium]
MTRAKKVWLSIGFTLLLLAGAGSFVPRMLWGDHADYSQVVSIKTSHEYQDPTLLTKAWALPVASLYKAELDYQQNGSFCGPTSLVNVLHSLHEPGDQSAILEGTGVSTVGGVLLGGLTLDQLAEIAQKKLGKRVTVLRDLDLAAFREQLRQSNDPARRYVINFTRGPLFATGGGHHSPIAGYLVDEDLVFVLDVNKKYGPWLVKSERLYQAMNTVDRSAKKKRGLLLIE